MLKIKNIFKLYISIFIFGLNLEAQNPFIQNKGQFPQKVISKIKLPSGALFIEEGKLRYTFYSGEQLAQVHDLKANDKNINAHSYIMDFMNSNSDVTIDFLEESKYYENYF